MKSVVLALALSFVSTQAFAQNPNTSATELNPTVAPRSKIMAISIEPLYMAIFGVALRTDLFVSDRASIGIQAFLENNRAVPTYDSFGTTSYYKRTYTEINLGTTIMLTGRIDKRGLYLNPSIGYMKASIAEFSSLNYSGESAGTLQGRATLGYQWTWGMFRMAVGAGWRYAGETAIIVKDGSGAVVHRSTFPNNGLAVDFHTGLAF